MSDDVPPAVREYVREHHADLAYVLRHGDDVYARACAYALLVRGGSAPDVEKVKRELEQAQEVLG